ncbi:MULTISPECIES: hypothetical protein [Actinomycetes]|uniref:hypothetical protein n=1 Tax=Actinomycetes TaxID=1760 RepID=UPI0024787BB9|nr:hypothetical protein [Amnibacterium kyonggiense]WDE72234.1 hypothetical protein [Amnibacterium kyonggiense]
MSLGLALPVTIAAAAVVAVPAAIARRQWALAVGFCAAGAGVAIQSPPVYAVVDPWLGDMNVTNLGYHLLTVTGIAAFLVLVLTANPGRDHRRVALVVAAATMAACGYQCVLFGFGVAGQGWATADAHLTEKLETPLFLAYAAVLWVALAGLAVAAIVTQRAQTRGRPWSIAKAGTTLVVAGSVIALFWCVNAAGRATMSVVTGSRSSPSDPLGQLLALLAGVGVFAGLAIITLPHLYGWFETRLLQVSTRRLWQRAVQVAPEVALHLRGRSSPSGRATLYRRWVEIEDAVRLGRLELTGRDRARLERLERVFAPATAPGRLGSAGSGVRA